MQSCSQNSQLSIRVRGDLTDTAYRSQ